VCVCVSVLLFESMRDVRSYLYLIAGMTFARIALIYSNFLKYLAYTFKYILPCCMYVCVCVCRWYFSKDRGQWYYKTDACRKKINNISIIKILVQYNASCFEPYNR